MIIILFFLFSFLTGSAQALEVANVAALPTDSSARVFTLLSPSFKQGDMIPDKYTCRGIDQNPPLTITNIPSGTKSMALTVHDPDGISGVWVHWVVFNIPPSLTLIKQGIPPGTQALNDFGNFYYCGPCPPDQKPHHYIFTLYALNAFLDTVNEGSTKDTLEKAMSGKVIAKAELTGIYQNVNWK
ncbi:MAG: YbhB/YbcL family Raf kinase inhibitor-like protein [Candidatus Omnitrophica bacterium]|nr:YbhB/YbcL family Raf kinase inhibitor-like protein [Candidatus Omnitrophota bacterium]